MFASPIGRTPSVPHVVAPPSIELPPEDVPAIIDELAAAAGRQRQYLPGPARVRHLEQRLIEVARRQRLREFSA